MKKILLLNHFDPEELYLSAVLNKSDEKILRKFKDGEDGYENYIIEDVTNLNGLHLILHNDEEIIVNKVKGETIKEVKENLIKELKEIVDKKEKEDINDDESDLEIDELKVLGISYYIPDYAGYTFEEMADKILDDIEESYVDGDSSYKMEFFDFEKGKYEKDLEYLSLSEMFQ